MTLKTTFTEETKSWIKFNLENGSDPLLILNILVAEGFCFNAVTSEMRFKPVLKDSFAKEWKDWIKKNLTRNADKNELFGILLMNGFTYDSIQTELRYTPNLSPDKLIEVAYSIQVNENSSLKQQKPTEVHEHILVNCKLQKIKADNIDLFVARKFLSEFECEKITEIIRSKLYPSQLAKNSTDKSFRTSSTCDLGLIKEELVHDIDQRICKIVNVNSSFSESMQGQYYEVGQEFKAHTDYFEKDEIKFHSKGLGQRTLTAMIYLNDVPLGGETEFPLLNKIFKAEKGMLLIWNNLKNDGSPNNYSLHRSKPVLNGYKSIITKWFREEKN